MTDTTDKRPAAVKSWDRAFRNRQAPCLTRCPKKHSGQGFCERSLRHGGMHSHTLRPGMKEYDPAYPKTGCSWGDNGPPKTPKRRKPEVQRGPLDGFA
jgi:hypothetical protein